MEQKPKMIKHAEILKAVQELRQGRPVALPTETVYGLAAPVDNPVAIESIFKIKNRPFFDPLIVHVNSIEMAQSCFTSWNLIAEKLAEVFWPGPLTIVMKKSKRIDDLITSGLENVGVRWPRHDLFNEVIESVNCPLAAPSANKFGRTSPTTYEHVIEEFKHDQLFVLDGGPCQVGIESTVLLIEEKNHQFQLCVLREGMISQDEIQQALSTGIKKNDQNWHWQSKDKVDPQSAPGHMKHHYMPNTPLILIENKNLNEEQIISCINEQFTHLPDVVESVQMIKPRHGVQKVIWMKLPEDSSLAARELYSQLRKSSSYGSDVILFQIETNHLEKTWAPIMDRLKKAASLVLH